jgi:hypothetical protein
MNKARIIVIVAVCFIAAGWLTLSVSQAGDKKSSVKEVTFNKDVAPIFFAKCAECHRPGEAAPFSVLSYKDARPWAKSIREKVVKREMPPWHADPHIGEFANDRRLTPQQIEAVTAWVDQGAKEGAPKDLPPAPQFVDGWSIGKPDVILPMPEEFTLDAEGADEYQYFDIPTNFTEDKYVALAEARPGNRKIVHHIIAFVVPPGQPNTAKMTREQRDKAVEMSLKNSPFYRDGFLIRMKPDQPVLDDLCGATVDKRRTAIDNGTFVAAYAPGRDVDRWEPGLAKKIPAGSSLRLQLHYSKVAGSAQKDRSMIGLVFAKEPPQRQVFTASVQNIWFQIPPGADRHKVTSCWVPKENWKIFALAPHMHYRGAAMEYKVTYPDGREQVLLNVPKYDFAWQTNYALKQPLVIPRNSKLTVTAYFDNSAKNKNNPDPSKPVRHGEPTYDEMMMGFFDYTVEKPPVAKVDPKIYDAYVGRYDLGNGRVYHLTKEGGKLMSQIPGNPPFELLPETETQFFWREVRGRLIFVKDEKGEVNEIIFDQGVEPAQAKRIKDAAAGGK